MVCFSNPKNFGLGLTLISDHFKHMQVVKCELLRNSQDTAIRELYKTREALNSSLTRVWKATKVSAIVNAEVDLNIKFPSQATHQGIGFGNFNPNPTALKRRKLVTSKVKSLNDESRLAHTVSLKQQAVWFNPFDLSWKNLIWGPLAHKSSNLYFLRQLIGHVHLIY